MLTNLSTTQTSNITQQNKIILKEAITWIDTKFEHGGFTKLGCDCSGLIVGILKNCNILPSVPEYHVTRHHNHLTKESVMDILEKYMIIIPMENLQPGDFIAFSFYKQPTHLAIVANSEPLEIIHAYKPASKVVITTLDKYWIKKIAYLLRLK